VIWYNIILMHNEVKYVGLHIWPDQFSEQLLPALNEKYPCVTFYILDMLWVTPHNHFTKQI